MSVTVIEVLKDYDKVKEEIKANEDEVFQSLLDSLQTIPNNDRAIKNLIKYLLDASDDHTYQILSKVVEDKQKIASYLAESDQLVKKVQLIMSNKKNNQEE